MSTRNLAVIFYCVLYHIKFYNVGLATVCLTREEAKEFYKCRGPSGYNDIVLGPYRQKYGLI